MLLHLALFLTAIFTVVLVALSVKRIPEGQVYSLRRLGRAPRILPAGTHVVLPLLDRVAHKISLGGHALHLAEPLDEAGSERVEGLVYWQVLEPERADAVIDSAEDLIRDNALKAWHATPADADVARNTLLKQALNQHLRPRGVLVTRVELQRAA